MVNENVKNHLNLFSFFPVKQIKLTSSKLKFWRKSDGDILAAYERDAMCASKRVGKFTFLPQSQQPAVVAARKYAKIKL